MNFERLKKCVLILVVGVLCCITGKTQADQPSRQAAANLSGSYKRIKKPSSIFSFPKKPYVGRPQYNGTNKATTGNEVGTLGPGGGGDLPPADTDPIDVPIDNGVIILLIIGLLFGYSFKIPMKNFVVKRQQF